jgi:hypothetical protein
MSTHAIGPVRLVLGSLLLMLVGAGLCWWFLVRGPGDAVLVVRDGSFEIESWGGDLTGGGTELVWTHTPTDAELGIYRSTGTDEEALMLGAPVRLPNAATIRFELKVAGGLTIPEAVVLSVGDGPLRVAVKNGRLERRGDVWVHQGFVVEGQPKRFMISKIECLDAGGRVVARYANPDQGRRVRFRLTLTAG